MSRVLFYRSVARYDALGCFADRLAGALRALHHEVDVVTYAGDDLATRLAAAFARRPDVVVSYNGLGAELERLNDRLYSRLGVPFLALTVDHPIYLFERLATPVQDHRATFVDHTHVDFVRKFIPAVQPTFLAHAADVPAPPVDGVPRDVPLVLPGSYEDPEALAREWRAFKPQTAELFEEVASRCLDDPRVGLYEHFEAAYMSRGLPPEVMTRAEVLKLLHLPDRYVRARWRSDCLAAFDRASLTIDVVGHNWAACPTIGRHRVHPPIDFAALTALMGRAQIVLAVGANFPTGSHERVLTAMAAGAATLSDHTRFYAESFVLGRDLVTYPQGRFDELAETVHALRADPARLQQLQQAGPRAIEGAHTFAARARKLVALLGLDPAKEGDAT